MNAGARLEVLWPSGIEQHVVLLKGKTEVVVREDVGAGIRRGEVVRPQYSLLPRPLFQHVQRDTVYDDFKVQPLLPAKQSEFGPCMAVADINGDGVDDVYVGGSRESLGRLFVSIAGRYQEVRSRAFSRDIYGSCEDTAAVWGDFDGDGDLDLLVGSGTNELTDGTSLNRHRLYLNESKGGRIEFRLQVVLEGLTDVTTVLAVADYDGDGDLDVFSGSGAKVGQYPLADVSRVLRNDTEKGKGGGVKFTDVTGEVFMGKGEMGIVRGAEWGDMDGDGDWDLVVASEWGNVVCYLNEKVEGKVVLSASTMLGKKSGMWRSVKLADVNGDGRLDVLCGNVGWNTRYKKGE